MTEFQKLTDTELEVMQVIWKLNRSVTSSELLEIFSKISSSSL